MNHLKVLIVILVAALATGCSTNVSRFQMPGSDLSTVETLHVTTSGDDRNADELRALIDADLKSRGYNVVTKGESTVMEAGDYVFDIASDWHWDITWYLLELRVAIYEPGSNTLIAQAQSQQTSLVRKDMETVVARVLASLFNDAGEETESEEESDE